MHRHERDERHHASEPRARLHLAGLQPHHEAAALRDAEGAAPARRGASAPAVPGERQQEQRQRRGVRLPGVSGVPRLGAQARPRGELLFEHRLQLVGSFFGTGGSQGQRRGGSAGPASAQVEEERALELLREVNTAPLTVAYAIFAPNVKLHKQTGTVVSAGSRNGRCGGF